MSSKWSGTSYPAAGTAASVSQPAPNSAGGADSVNRIRSFTISAAGDGTNPTGIIHIVIRNGATGTGTIIWNGVVSAPAIGSSALFLTDLDIRCSLGNAITIESANAPANNGQLAISVEGDIVPVGYPGYAIPQGA